jgi:hypothetical protein
VVPPTLPCPQRSDFLRNRMRHAHLARNLRSVGRFLQFADRRDEADPVGKEWPLIGGHYGLLCARNWPGCRRIDPYRRCRPDAVTGGRLVLSSE